MGMTPDQTHEILPLVRAGANANILWRAALMTEGGMRFALDMNRQRNHSEDVSYSRLALGMYTLVWRPLDVLVRGTGRLARKGYVAMKTNYASQDGPASELEGLAQEASPVQDSE
jgi:hypothetical protein